MKGPVYSKVIDTVCEQSQVDFEEGGIDQGTLELLKSVRRRPSNSKPLFELQVRFVNFSRFSSCFLPCHNFKSNHLVLTRYGHDGRDGSRSRAQKADF